MKLYYGKMRLGIEESEKERKEKRIAGLFVLYLFFCSDALLFCYNMNEALVDLAQYAMVAVSVLLLICLFIERKGRVERDFFVLIVAELFMFIAGLYHSEFSGGYISKMALFLMGYCTFKLFSARRIFDAYLKVLTAVCIFSLIGFVLSPIIQRISFFPVIENNIGYEFRWFGLTNIPINISAKRNYGPFTEPSRFQAYINFGILLLLFYKKGKFDTKSFVLFAVTLASTFSTTGFISFAIILIAFLFSPNTKLKSLQKTLLILVLVGFIIVMFTFNENFAGSLLKLVRGSESESYSVRHNSIFGGLRLIFNNFWFGTGVRNANAQFIRATSSLYTVQETTTYTSTILMGFSKFGVVPGAYYTWNLWKTLKTFCRENRMISVIIFIAFFCMLSGISFIESMFFNVLVFAHFNLNAEEKIEKI